MRTRLAVLSVVAALGGACSPWVAYRTARRQAVEDLRCADERLSQVPRMGRGVNQYTFRGCGAVASYRCVQHQPTTLCLRTD